MSKSTIETNTSAGERSFQRVSGRKLPSAFSEGMTSEQFRAEVLCLGLPSTRMTRGPMAGQVCPKNLVRRLGVMQAQQAQAQ
jgi:hypothetical protein